MAVSCSSVCELLWEFDVLVLFGCVEGVDRWEWWWCGRWVRLRRVRMEV
jgi:hypothetical protein